MIIIALPPAESWPEHNIISTVRWKFHQYTKTVLVFQWPCVAVVMVLPANLVISIEGIQSSGER